MALVEGLKARFLLFVVGLLGVVCFISLFQLFVFNLFAQLGESSVNTLDSTQRNLPELPNQGLGFTPLMRGPSLAKR